jgi:ATP-binding cassette, subfamily B, bacterial
MSGNVLLRLLSLGIMFCLSPLLAIISLIIAPMLSVISYRMRWRVFPATWDGQQRAKSLYGARMRAVRLQACYQPLLKAIDLRFAGHELRHQHRSHEPRWAPTPSPAPAQRSR